MTENPSADVSDALARRRALARAPVDEAGGGEAEGFELAEALLVEHASHGDSHTTEPIMMHSGKVDEEEGALAPDRYGEADTEGPRRDLR